MSDQGHSINRLIRLTLFLLLTCLFLCPRPIAAALTQDDLTQRIKIAAPASSARIEVIPGKGTDIYAVLAHYTGPALPPVRSIVLSLDAPDSGRVHASFFQGEYLRPYQAKPAWVKSLKDMPKQTEFAIWRESSGEWGAMISLAGGGMRTYLEGTRCGISVIADSLADNFAPSGPIPMFVIGWDRDPYRLVHALYVHGFAVMHQADPDGVIGKLRVEKDYPDIFRYVGWCSWCAHFRNINERNLLENARSIKQSGFPIRWLLIDDGWSTVSTASMMPWNVNRLYLTGFPADPARFPKGLGHTVQAMKQDYGFTWVGVWHTINGYWSGVELYSPLAHDYANALLPVSKKAAIPDPRSEAGERFWDDWYKYLAGAGVDFVKVDNQGTLAAQLHGMLPISKAMGQAQLNLQRPAKKFFHSNALNCMEMNVENIYQWKTTNLGRSSVDYQPISYHNPRINTLTNVMNSLWFSEVSYPDYDMFMTNDGHAEYYAMARAISGGPVYTTDKAGKERWDVLWPLVQDDGLIIRTDQPGLPVRKNILRDPLREGVPLAAFAPVGSGGVLAVWNVDRLQRPVKMTLAPADIEGIKGERFAVYEHFSGTLAVRGRKEEFPVRLKGWEERLYTVVPIEQGFAAVGLAEKYISAGTVKGVTRSPGSVTVALSGAGTLVAYCEQRPAEVRLNGSVLGSGAAQYQGAALKVKVPKGTAEPEIKISWK